MLKKINLWAVGLGFLTDILLSCLLGTIIVAIGYSGWLLPLFFGLFSTAVGGYVTARVAPKNKLHNATMVAIIDLLSSIPLVAHIPFWFIILSLITIIPAARLGGKIALR